MFRKIGILSLIMISLLILGGCKPLQSQGETGNPTAAYPAPGMPSDNQTDHPSYPPPAGGQGPAAAPVRDNASLMKIEILSIAADEKDPANVNLHVKVISTSPTNGLPEYDPSLAGKEIDIHLPTADAAGLSAGQTLNLTVSYRGDEWGGGYYGSNPSPGS